MYFIEPTLDEISRALQSWSWLPVAGKHVVIITAFGDFFLEDSNGIWFLDTLEGALTLVCKTRLELDGILQVEEAQDHYLYGGFVERAEREGMVLQDGQCFGFKIHPAIGGPISYENVMAGSFVATVNLVGQLLRQVHERDGSMQITGFTVTE